MSALNTSSIYGLIAMTDFFSPLNLATILLFQTVNQSFSFLVNLITYFGVINGDLSTNVLSTLTLLVNVEAVGNRISAIVPFLRFK